MKFKTKYAVFILNESSIYGVHSSIEAAQESIEARLKELKGWEDDEKEPMVKIHFKNRHEDLTKNLYIQQITVIDNEN